MKLKDMTSILWLKITPTECGYRLAATGAIKDTAFAYDDVALFLAGYLGKRYPEASRSRYRIESVPEEDVPLLEAVGRARACLGRSGGVDFDKVSAPLVNDLRAGLAGPTSVATRDMIEKDLADAQRAAEIKAQQKAERDAARRARARKKR